ncbi:zinc transporter ZIP14-like isoform X1 [Dendronephthya gigantea]|uniref:zinc transporter ZIP14-like isoform X1 n=1 Tax=Dendronephthya gigantea TaxID=151771 RepID=UPI00106A98F2|nr:zinc transporter ZIP14-like isoform X1 [Dendronephthya gigantea]
MFIFSLLQCFCVATLSTQLTQAQVIHVEVEKNHKIVVRSTPSLDPAEEILEAFGNDNKINLTDMEALFRSIRLAVLNDKDSQGKGASDPQVCFTSQHFYGMYSRNDGTINRTDLLELCPAVLYQLTKKPCHAKETEVVEKEEDTGKENPTRAWGFGFLFVTIISFGSLIGAFVVPMMGKPFYKKTLMCMVSLAVGVLGGSGIFHLIPSALGFPFDDNDNSYLWKCAMIFAGLYLFLILECSMKLFIRFKDIRKMKHAASEIETVPSDEKPALNDSELHSIGINSGLNGHGHSHHNGGPIFPTVEIKRQSTVLMNESSQTELANVSTEEIKNSGKTEKPAIATVAWMIIIGDGLHNFIDGLAIGASFSGSVVIGISTSLAVICEELPHELGDFAILLKSGLNYKQAMLANFLSACLCYVGLVIGLVLGYATHAVKYIYGIAGGMFIYISLVDMLPEALEMAHALSGNSKSKSIKMLLIVNFAITLGFCVMLIIALYGTSIEL